MRDVAIPAKSTANVAADTADADNTSAPTAKTFETNFFFRLNAFYKIITQLLANELDSKEKDVTCRYQKGSAVI
ncbi:MAG: hypothetical protein AB8B58_20160 [Roseobacter sp.]